MSTHTPGSQDMLTRLEKLGRQVRGLKRAELLVLAFVVLAASVGLGQTTHPAERPLTGGQIEDLLEAGVDSARIAEAVRSRGIDLNPTEEFLEFLRSKGAGEALLNALRDTKPPPLGKSELLRLLAEGEDSARLAALVQRCGIDFKADDQDLDTLRIAGASEALLRAVREGKQQPYRVGGNVSAPIPIYQPMPAYSKEALKAKQQGTVVLWIVVNADGSVSDVRVVKPLGLSLDEKAVETVKTWKFRPGMRNGVPVPVLMSVEVVFHLGDAGLPVIDKPQERAVSSPCRVTFAVMLFDWDHPDGESRHRVGLMTDRQWKWWQAHGRKDFPHVCLVEDQREADYLVEWASRAYQYVGARPTVDITHVSVAGIGGTISNVYLVPSIEQGTVVEAFVVDERTQQTIWQNSSNWHSPDKVVLERAVKFIRARK